MVEEVETFLFESWTSHFVLIHLEHVFAKTFLDIVTHIDTPSISSQGRMFPFGAEVWR